MNGINNNERTDRIEQNQFLEELQPFMETRFVEQCIDEYARSKNLSANEYDELYQESHHQIHNRGSIQLPNQSEGDFFSYKGYQEALERGLKIVDINPLLEPIADEFKAESLQQQDRKTQMMENVIFAEGIANKKIKLYKLPDGRRVLESDIEPVSGHSLFPSHLKMSATHNVFGLDLKTYKENKNGRKYERIILPPKQVPNSQKQSPGIYSLIHQ